MIGRNAAIAVATRKRKREIIDIHENPTLDRNNFNTMLNRRANKNA